MTSDRPAELLHIVMGRWELLNIKTVLRGRHVGGDAESGRLGQRAQARAREGVFTDHDEPQRRHASTVGHNGNGRGARRG